MIFLCKLNIFFIFNSLLLVFTAYLSTNEENGIKSSDEMILLKFKDEIIEISKKDLNVKYSILVDDDVLNKNEIVVDFFNINNFENLKILKRGYEETENEETENEETENEETENEEIVKIEFPITEFEIDKFLKFLFKENNFRTFLNFLKKFGKKNFQINKFRFLTYLEKYIKNFLPDFKTEVEFYTDIFKCINSESISEFIYVFSYIQKEIIINCEDVHCYITIDCEMNSKITEFKNFNCKFRISEEEPNVSERNKKEIPEILPLLDFLKGFVEFYKKSIKKTEIIFKTVVNSRYKGDFEQYGDDFIWDLDYIIIKNAGKKILDKFSFKDFKLLISDKLCRKIRAFQFNLLEKFDEGKSEILFLLNWGSVILSPNEVHELQCKLRNVQERQSSI